MYFVNKSWFYEVIGDIVNWHENCKIYSCDNIEDIKLIAADITIPSYEKMKKESIAWYINYRTTFFYLMKFGDEAEKLSFRRLQDVIIANPSKKSIDFFLEYFYPILWEKTFGEFQLSLNIDDFKLVDDSRFSVFDFYGNYYYQ